MMEPMTRPPSTGVRATRKYVSGTNSSNAMLGKYPGWLKKLNYVTGRVFAENHFTPRPLHNIVSEAYTIVREL